MPYAFRVFPYSFWECMGVTIMAPKTRSCWLLLLLLQCLLCTQGSAQDANCSAATEQPVFSGVYPPAGTSTITYTIFGELLSQVVAITITIGGADVPSNILSRNSSAIQFRFVNVPSPATANVSLQPNNTACETLSRTVSLHRFRKCTCKHDILSIV